MGLFGYIIIY